MRTRTLLTMLLFLQFNALIFGTLAVIVLTVPALNAHAAALLPAAAAFSLLAAPLAWIFAPRLRARYWRRRGERPKALAA